MCLAVTVHVFTSSNPKPVSGSISHSDKHLRPEWELEDPEEDAAEDETSKRPDIAGHPNNNNNNKNGNNNNNNTAGNLNNTEYKIPSGGQVSDFFLLSLRPRTKMP